MDQIQSNVTKNRIHRKPLYNMQNGSKLKYYQHKKKFMYILDKMCKNKTKTSLLVVKKNNDE